MEVRLYTLKHTKRQVNTKMLIITAHVQCLSKLHQVICVFL